MRWWVALIFVVGCAPTAQERLNELSSDGLHLYRQGSFAGARDMFKAALEVRPEDPAILYNLARCHEKLGDQQSAQKYYEKCLEYEPDHAEARHAIVARLVAEKKPDDAARYVSRWLRSNPRLAAPYIEDGWLYAQEGDIDSAPKRYLQALALEPRNPRALRELAALYEQLDRPEKALVMYERSLEVDPDQSEIRKRLKELRARGVSRPHPE